MKLSLHTRRHCQKENKFGQKISTDRKVTGNTQERYIKADPEECIRHVRVLIGTGIAKLDNLQETSTFTILFEIYKLSWRRNKEN